MLRDIIVKSLNSVIITEENYGKGLEYMQMGYGT
jgi:hypothetical protein